VKLDWDALNDQDFEELCYDILNMSDFHNLEWFGRGGGDRGRDITCIKTDLILGNIKRETMYLVQCKKYVARPPSPSDLNDTIAWADAHKPHVLLIMVSNTLRPSTRDWLSKIRKDKLYEILVYEEKDFEDFLEKNEDLYKRHFERKEKKPIIEVTTSETRKRVLICLVDKSKKTIEDLSKETNEPVPKVEPVLKNLLSKRIVVSSKGKKDRMMTLYSLAGDMKTFIKIAEELLLTDYRFDFLTSSFSRDMINKDLATYVESRYFLKLSDQFKDGLAIILKTSPGALHHSLFSDNRPYETGYHHLESFKMPDEMRRKWATSYVNSFTSDLLEKMLVDLHHPDCKKTLQQNNIEGYKLGIGLKMASIEKPIIDLSSESVVMLIKAKGAIEAGALVSATDPGLFIRVGGILMNLGLYEGAVKEYDLAIEQVKDKEKRKAAWNNKGVCLMRLNRIPDAIPCFEEALNIDPNLKEAQKNKQKCLDLMNPRGSD